MKLLHKDTQTTWTVENLLKEGFIKVGSKTYEEYWKDTKTNDILVLSVIGTGVSARLPNNLIYNLSDEERDKLSDLTLKRIEILSENIDEYDGDYLDVKQQQLVSTICVNG